MTAQLEVGDIVQTSYGTGPYRIVEIISECTCASYLDTLNGNEQPSLPHVHLKCVRSDFPVSAIPRENDLYYLNGYTVDGDGQARCVWSGDMLTVTGKAMGIQLGLGL